jgi:hypothetical protein
MSAQSIYDTYSGFTTPTTAVLPAVEKHPSLYFDSSQIDALKLRKSSSAYANVWSRVTSSIAKFKAMSATTTDENDHPKIAKYCAFAWVMNADAAAKQKAIDALMTAYDYYGADSTNFDKPYDEIYRATWIQNYCEAYDWIQSQLTPQQDSTVRAKLTREAQILRKYMPSYAPRPHNHRSKPAYGLGTAALTFTRDSRAVDWLQYALEQINTVTKYQFSSDGIYREGAHYYVYTLVNEIPFLWQYKIVSGVDLFPYYKASFEWPVLIRDQRGWLPNNEDGNVKPAPTHMVAQAYMTTPTRLHSKEPLGKILQWNWTMTNFFTPDYTGAATDVCWDIDEFLTYDASIPAVAPDCDPTLKLATGQVVFRNGWANADTTMRYLLYLGAAAADNHDHPDELSYIVNARNTCLAVDGGYGQDAWNHDTWYLAPVSHNLVTTNDASPSDFAVNQTPPDRHFLTTSFIDFSEKEAKTSATNGQIRRGIAFVDNDYWLVYDLPVSTNASTIYKLNIHARGSMIRTGNQASWTVASDKSYGDAAKLHAAVYGSGTLAFANKSGYTCLYKDSVTQQFVEAQQTHDTAAFLHLLLTSSTSTGAPLLTDISAGAARGFEFARPNSMTDGCLIHTTSRVETAGLCATNGPFAWWHRAGSELRFYAVTDAGIFRWNGVDVLSSNFPITCAADFSLDTVKSITIDSLVQPVVLTIAATKVSSCLFNGNPISFVPDGKGNISVTVPKSGVLVINRSGAAGVGKNTEQLPRTYGLEQNFPNPFNPTTSIRFRIPQTSHLQLRVTDLLGNNIRTLTEGNYVPGVYELQWDGKDYRGQPVASGVYFFELHAGSFIARMKGILLR